MLLARKSDSLCVSERPFQNQTHTYCHLQQTSTELTKCHEAPGLKNLLLISYAKQKWNINYLLSINKLSHAGTLFLLFFLWLPTSHRAPTPSPQAEWQSGAAQVEWFTCWTGGFTFERHHVSLGADTISQKVIKRQSNIQIASIAHFYDCIQLHFTMFSLTLLE